MIWPTWHFATLLRHITWLTALGGKSYQLYNNLLQGTFNSDSHTKLQETIVVNADGQKGVQYDQILQIMCWDRWVRGVDIVIRNEEGGASSSLSSFTTWCLFSLLYFRLALISIDSLMFSWGKYCSDLFICYLKSDNQSTEQRATSNKQQCPKRDSVCLCLRRQTSSDCYHVACAPCNCKFNLSHNNKIYYTGSVFRNFGPLDQSDDIHVHTYIHCYQVIVTVDRTPIVSYMTRFLPYQYRS